MDSTSCRILWTGDAEHHEFRELLDWLRAQPVVMTLQHDVDQAATLLADGTTPYQDLVIVAQSRPRQFSQTSLERLHRAAPLTSVIAVLGSWCEGDGRSGLPWKGIPRYYWHQLRSRLARGLEASAPLTRCRWPEWHLPRTMTEAERSLEAAHQPLPASRGTSRRLANPHLEWVPKIWLVRASNLTTYETLAGTLRLARSRSVWWPPHRPAPPRHGLDGILWDADQLDDFEWARIGESLRVPGSPPVIVLAGFLRQHEKQRLVDLGVSAVLTKPLSIESLLHELLHAENRTNEVPSNSH